MHRVHGEATEHVGANRLGRNGMHGCVHQEGFWTEHVMETRPDVLQDGGNGPPRVETGVLLIGRGVAYRKTEETDLCWSATVETGVLFIGRGLAYRKTEETDLLGSKRGSC